MNKRYFYFFMALICHCGLLYAQLPYYGTPFYKEGFDGATVPWTQKGETVNAEGIRNSYNSAWALGNMVFENGNFKMIDAESQNSLLLTIKSGNGLVSSITSPRITNTESSLCIGFSTFSYDLVNGVFDRIFPKSDLVDWGYLAFEVSTDSTNWEILWRSDQTPKYEYILKKAGAFSGWATFQTNLPAKYNGKDIFIRFRINSEEVRSGNVELYIDGVFISKRRVKDAEVMSVNNFSTTGNNANAYFKVPVRITFKNMGTSDISSIVLGYKRDKSAIPVTETYTPQTPIKPGETATYTFNSQADFSAYSTTDGLTAWTALEGDEYSGNDKIQYTIENLMVSTPYAARWLLPGYPGNGWDFIQVGKGNNTYPFWSQGSYPSTTDTCQYIDPSKKILPADSYLFSRPLHLKAGATYKLEYSARLTKDSLSTKSKLDIMLATRFDTTSIFSTLKKIDAVDESSWLGQSLQFTATKDTSFYIVFHAFCPPGSAPLYLWDVAVKQTAPVDVELSSLLSPVNMQDNYTNKEPIKIKITNSGTQAIAAGTLTAYYTIDNLRSAYVNPAVTEKISAGIAPGESLEYTFSVNADLSSLETRKIRAGVLMNGDQLPDNNEKVFTISAKATYAPYILNLGNMFNSTYEERTWELNNWIVSAIAAESRFQYSGYANAPNKTVGSLYSRPIRLIGGNKYTISYNVMGTVANNTIPLSAGIYEKANSAYNLVEMLNQNPYAITAENRNKYTSFTYEFTAPYSGDFCLGYIITPDADGIKSNVMVNNVKVLYPGDVKISRIIMPAKYRSLSDETYVGAIFQNVGTTQLASVPVTYNINGTTVTEYIQIDTLFQPGTSHYFAFLTPYSNKSLEKGADCRVSVYSNYPGDANLSNDTTSLVLSPSETIQGYGNLNKPAEVSTGESSVSQPLYANTNDGRVYVSFEQFDRGKYSYYAQLLDRAGIPQFPGQGKLVSDLNYRTYAIRSCMTVDKQNNFINAYVNLSNYSQSDANAAGELRISKISPQGDYLFGKEGIILAPKTTALPALAGYGLLTDSKSDIYLLNGGKIMKLDGETGNTIKEISLSVISWIIDEKDLIYVTYLDGSALKLQIYDTDLNPTLKIVPTINETIGANKALIFKEPEGGLWILFAQLGLYYDEFYIQYLDKNFEPTCGLDGVPLTPNLARARTGAWGAPILSDNTFGIVFAETSRGGESAEYLRAQKINKNGERLLAAEGKELISAIAGSEALNVNGLTYNSDNSKLYVNFSVYAGTASRLDKNSYVQITDASFNREGQINYSKNDNDMLGNRTYSDDYGMYFVWRGGSMKGQHMYFDGTIATRNINIDVVSDNYNQGYTTGGGLLNIGDKAVARAFATKGFKFKEWTSNGVSVSTANPYKFDVTGEVSLTASFDINTDIQTIENDKPVFVYPNPASDYIFFADGYTGEASIYNLSGQLVASQHISAGEKMNVSKLVKGMYIIQLKGETAYRQVIIIE